MDQIGVSPEILKPSQKYFKLNDYNSPLECARLTLICSGYRDIKCIDTRSPEDPLLKIYHGVRSENDEFSDILFSEFDVDWLDIAKHILNKCADLRLRNTHHEYSRFLSKFFEDFTFEDNCTETVNDYLSSNERQLFNIRFFAYLEYELQSYSDLSPPERIWSSFMLILSIKMDYLTCLKLSSEKSDFVIVVAGNSHCQFYRHFLPHEFEGFDLVSRSFKTETDTIHDIQDVLRMHIALV